MPQGGNSASHAVVTQLLDPSLLSVSSSFIITSDCGSLSLTTSDYKYIFCLRFSCSVCFYILCDVCACVDLFKSPQFSVFFRFYSATAYYSFISLLLLFYHFLIFQLPFHLVIIFILSSQFQSAFLSQGPCALSTFKRSHTLYLDPLSRPYLN